MSEHGEDPVGHASSTIVPYVSLATMAAEAIAQVRQQRAASAAAVDERTAAAARAQQTAAHAAARLQWRPVLDPRRHDGLTLADTGVAWAATQAWREIDPEAQLASDRALDRLRQLRPDVMDRFDRLTADSLDPVEAMRRVAPFFDRPPARQGQPATRAAVSAADGRNPVDAELPVHAGLPVGAGLPVADAAARAAQDSRGQYAERTAVTDDPTTPAVGEDLVAAGQADPHLAQAGVLDRRAGQLQTDAGLSLVASRTPPQIAQDGYPEPLTGQVLAAGQIKPKTPDRTAPAAVRGNSLATAARAPRAR